MNYFQSVLVFLAYSTVGYAIREALDEEFPFQVSVKSQDNRHLCGGAVITSRWVITTSTCLSRYNEVLVSYGSADANSPLNSIASEKIIHQKELDFGKKNRFALIRLTSKIEFSNTVAQGKLPVDKVKLPDVAKLSGWNVNPLVDLPPSLFVTDKYNIITENCKKQTGMTIFLAADEFCGEDEEGQNKLVFPGTLVSKGGIILGLLPSLPSSAIEPPVFVKLSEHEQWIRDTLGPDAQYVSWVDKVPKNSADHRNPLSLIFIGISALFVRFF